MENFAGKIAVITGGGTGMGRELARQLSAEGCHVAMCDVSAENMAETVALCLADAPAGTRVTTFVADVSQEAQLIAFARGRARPTTAPTTSTCCSTTPASVAAAASSTTAATSGRPRSTSAGAASTSARRTFMPLLVASDEGHIVNTSSVNGFWASLGPNIPHTAYSAAKFAVKGFTEALITDLRQNAPHVKASVVMPGHIGTSIVINSGKFFGRDPKEMTSEQLADVRDRLGQRGHGRQRAPATTTCASGMQMQAEMFRDAAPDDGGAGGHGHPRRRARRARGASSSATTRSASTSWCASIPQIAYDPEFLPHLRARGLFSFATDREEPK